MLILFSNPSFLFDFQGLNENQNPEVPIVDPRKRCKKRTSTAIRPVNIPCEWNMCSKYFNKVEDYLRHLAEHISEESGE